MFYTKKLNYVCLLNAVCIKTTVEVARLIQLVRFYLFKSAAKVVGLYFLEQPGLRIEPSGSVKHDLKASLADSEALIVVMRYWERIRAPPSPGLGARA